MRKTVFLVEDTTGGKMFYQLLNDNGFFENVQEILDFAKDTGFKNIGYDFSYALNHLLDNKILEQNDTVVIMVDNQIPLISVIL